MTQRNKLTSTECPLTDEAKLFLSLTDNNLDSDANKSCIERIKIIIQHFDRIHPEDRIAFEKLIKSLRNNLKRNLTERECVLLGLAVSLPSLEPVSSGVSIHIDQKHTVVNTAATLKLLTKRAVIHLVSAQNAIDQFTTLTNQKKIDKDALKKVTPLIDGLDHTLLSPRQNVRIGAMHLRLKNNPTQAKKHLEEANKDGYKIPSDLCNFTKK